MSDNIDPREIDQRYVPFPSFSVWLMNTSFESARWNRHVEIQSEVRLQPEAVLSRARLIATRAAAIDTGAIEGLYEVDRGFTFTVAMEAAAWQSAVAAKGEKFRALFEAQLSAYEYVLDFATGATPFGEAMIRALHERICKGQATYQVMTKMGPQLRQLRLGEYKSSPNHVLRADGSSHAYCPVDMTSSEMRRLVNELRATEFENAPAVQQSAYAHYAFVAVHPFADGNGRVARALASIYTYRDQSAPLVILMENRAEYYSALSEADKGKFQPFASFIFSRAIDSMQMVQESVLAANAPAPEMVTEDLKRLYVTPSGFTHRQVDEAGTLLLHELAKMIQARADSLATESFNFGVSIGNFKQVPHSEGLRGLVQNPIQALLRVACAPPADASVDVFFAVSVPKQSSTDDDVVIWLVDRHIQFSAPVSGCISALSAGVQMRLRMFVERIVGETLHELRSKAEDSLRKKGYR